MKTLFGMKINHDRNIEDYWKQACSSWIDTQRQLCQNFTFLDAPWEYLEVTNSSLLAGSLTSAGAPAMPETFVMRKHNKSRKRVDICIVMKNSTTTNVELVECKLAEYYAIRRNSMAIINREFDNAREQVNNITGLNGIEFANLPQLNPINRTGVVIGLPCFRPNVNSLQRANAINQIVIDLQNIDMDACAWYFPGECFDRLSDRYQKYYPGTFVAIKKF